MIEALRRLGAFRRNRTLVLGSEVYRVRRDRLVRIPDRWADVGGGGPSGHQRQRWGRGANGRMDWERQRQVMREFSYAKRRHFSFYTKDIERRRRARLDRWSVRDAIAEWLYTWELSFFDYDDYSFWDDGDQEERGVTWRDAGWSVTLPDLLR